MTTATVAILALGICVAGVLWRIGRWIGSDFEPNQAGGRHGVLVSPVTRRPGSSAWAKATALPVVFLRDIVFQVPLLRQDAIRWTAHMAVCYGFLLLVAVHALDDWTAPVLFADYAPTRNPFRWLRNALAAIVLAGAAAAVLRHRAGAAWKGRRSLADRFFLSLLAVVVVSGVVLESAQIVSPSLYAAMVEDYMGFDDPTEVAALGHFWAAEFGAVPGPSGQPLAEVDPAAGREVHLSYCADCHAPPQSAFLSYPLSRIVRPAAEWMDAFGIQDWLWQLHFLASCLALACLPFSKVFHLVATPANLMVRVAGPVATQPTVLRPFRRALGMDACTHCGLCTLHCSVAPHHRVMANTAILPSEKLQQLRHLRANRLTPFETARLAEGSYICTLCGRCTARCPSGIDLQDLWQASRLDLIQKGFPPFNGHRATTGDTTPAALPSTQDRAPLSLALTDRPETFWACVQCTTCTNVCPVVAASEDPHRDLDLTPQQIMNLMRLQLKEEALHCRMLWDCVTCYKCQEHCPQDVKVADVLYELRNIAWQRRIQAPPDAVDKTATAQPREGAESASPFNAHEP